MAKKKKTPPPPRPVQAPKRRDQPTTGGFSTRTKLVAAAAAVLVAAVIIVAALAATGGGGNGNGSAAVAKSMTSAGCTFKTYPNQGRTHVQSLAAKVDYHSFPPTSGPHYFQPAVWNAYDGPLVLVQEVHNLEHGGVIVQYGSRVSEATVKQLQSFYRESPNALLLAPLPKLRDRISLSAWTHLATCRRFAAAAFRTFRDAYRGKEPERFPVSALTPGS
jgi:hypothetical protein